MMNEAMHGIGRRHVEALHADLGRQLAARHLQPGQHPDQLLGAATRVQGGHYRHCDRHGAPAAGRAHGLHRLRLVVLDADEAAFGAQQVLHDFDAAHDGLGPFTHQHVVAGDERLALGAVEDQRFNRMHSIRAQLDVRREGGAPEADHASLAQALEHG
ncbi:hypothetical protein GALL_312470 [mine drainage metagenome]|uniref:Uncharacterized protein n=1 Tax=mine drainage metagenome TaxID=410659 RepID=A0A1J5RB76_9ZZZZ